VGIAVLGIIAMLVAAFVYRSPFFMLRRVAYRPEDGDSVAASGDAGPGTGAEAS
jgi:hypothetical protein